MQKKLTEFEAYNNIDFLAQEIKKGKIIILPTSTIYGICCNALDKIAVKKIYKIKKREYNKPLIVLVNDYNMLEKVCFDLNKIESKIADNFWPGPLTMILQKKNIIPKIVTANNNTVGVRIDLNNLVNLLIEKAGVPIVAPSANISGSGNITSIDELEDIIKENVDYIIDSGRLDNIIESTLIKVEKDSINILREGKISKEEIYNLK